MVKRAIVAGAGGMTGGELLSVLLSEPGYDEVLILVRKELKIAHPRLKQLVVNFDEPASYADFIKGDVIFCCLGSTLKKTPDLKDYRKVDHDYPLQLAEAGVRNGVNQYHLVSSIGANIKSSNFYTRMKGETEEDLKKTGIPGIHIYQPSFLTGDRKEQRPRERFFVALMRIIDPLLLGGLKKYRSIQAATVANAMYRQSLKNEKGIHTYSSDKIKELA
ncbi:MAG TPA: NAD(P)H-binding protein [Mucilaginibacter sp.]|nr:NAD(P)H-binding protein [Mucilaginibacter sp.]